MNYYEFEKRIKSDKTNLFSLGKSTLGKDIWACHVGKETGSQVLVQAGIHAREYVTCLLAEKEARNLQGEHLPFGVIFVFCANPDGVNVVLDGFSALREEERKFCEEKNFNHKLFKANANLVDLNTNFNALWGQGKSNRFSPYLESYVGKNAESEVETQILRDFTLFVRPKLTLSYHTKGEVIYFGFDTQNQTSLERDEKIGRKISQSLGFQLERSFGSCGGFKDWACDKLDIPSYTIEFGDDKLSHPLGEEVLETLEEQSQNLFKTIEEFLK